MKCRAKDPGGIRCESPIWRKGMCRKHYLRHYEQPEASPGARHAWTPEDDKLLMDLRDGGATWKTISHALHRTFDACEDRYEKLGGYDGAEVEADPSVERCTCGLVRDKDHQVCDLLPLHWQAQRRLYA